jgi:hypothetical protein
MPPPSPLRVKEPSKYMLQYSSVIGGGGCQVSIHLAMKSARAWDLIAIWGMWLMSSPMSSSAHLEILPVARRFPTISPSPNEVTT